LEKEGKPSENVIGETFQGGEEHGKGGEEIGVLGAIGETIAEIAQQTKELVIGEDQKNEEEASHRRLNK
jgi:hypothetical protein